VVKKYFKLIRRYKKITGEYPVNIIRNLKEHQTTSFARRVRRTGRMTFDGIEKRITCNKDNPSPRGPRDKTYMRCSGEYVLKGAKMRTSSRRGKREYESALFHSFLINPI